jgi:hypothetical protein
MHRHLAAPALAVGGQRNQATFLCNFRQCESPIIGAWVASIIPSASRVYSITDPSSLHELNVHLVIPLFV